MARGDAVIPTVAAIVQRAARIYAADSTGHEKLVADCPNVSLASWVAWSLAQAHGAPHKVESAVPPEEGDEDEVHMSLQFTGPLDDPRILALFGILSGNVPLPKITPELRRQAVQEILQT